MSIENIVRIETDDTKKVYEFPSKVAPQLWSVNLSCSSINQEGVINSYATVYKSFVLERQTLIDCGMITSSLRTDKEPEKKNTEDVLRDLLTKLLSELGIYPEY